MGTVGLVWWRESMTMVDLSPVDSIVIKLSRVRAGYLRALRFGSEAPVNCLADTIGAACDNRLDCELVM